MSLLSTQGLRKSFGGLEAVAGVDLSVNAGEVRALIGPNGAGKTTLVGLICGRLSPSAGQVHFDGRDITGLAADARIRLGMAYTFQITSIFPGLPVPENVALAARNRHPSSEVDRIVDDALARVGLAPEADELAGNLSYGHQRLLEIAMGLAQSPKLLILDEPTQGLSEGEVSAFNHLVRELAGQMTILLIEHNMDVVMAIADQVTVLTSGRVLAEGTPDYIRADAAVQAAYLGER
ncbi:MAG: ABC transporter ATP-binding protein [Pseudomonadota bacterium]